MGMFDYIKCEYPLPDGFGQGRDISFQTKDLECAMDTYVIDEEGFLNLEKWGVRDLPATQHRKSTGILNAFWDAHERVFEGLEKVDYTGEVEFYYSNIAAMGPEGFSTRNDEPYEARTYTAVFEKGVLIKLKKEAGRADGVSDMRWLPRHEIDRLHQESMKRREAEQEAAEQIVEQDASEMSYDKAGVGGFVDLLKQERERLGPDGGRSVARTVLAKLAKSWLGEGGGEKNGIKTEDIGEWQEILREEYRTWRPAGEEFLMAASALLEAIQQERKGGDGTIEEGNHNHKTGRKPSKG